MSSVVVKTYLFHCDGPSCDTIELIPREHEAPTGWRTVKSTDHQSNPSCPYGVGRRAVQWMNEQGARSHGWFRIHLCPRHLGAFDGHLPRTDGIYQPDRRGSAFVECSCGVKLGQRSADYGESVEAGPRRYTERAWWEHLPAELRSYTRPWAEPARA